MRIFNPVNIDLKDTLFAPELEKDPKENPIHEPSVSQENKINMLT